MTPMPETTPTPQSTENAPVKAEAVEAAAAAPVQAVEAKPAEVKTEAAPEAVKPAEEKPVEIKYPEGSKAEDWSDIVAIAQASKLDAEATSKLIEAQAKSRSSMISKAAEAWEKTKAGWIEQLKSDKKFGGTEYDKNVALARKGFQRFGSEALQNFLSESGLDNHPELVKAFAAVGKYASEGDLNLGVRTGVGGNGQPDAKATLRSLYSKSPELFKE